MGGGSKNWLTGGKAAYKNLEKNQENIGGNWWVGVVQLQGLQ